jgi:hypothetical protein
MCGPIKQRTLLCPIHQSLLSSDTQYVTEMDFGTIDLVSIVLAKSSNSFEKSYFENVS